MAVYLVAFFAAVALSSALPVKHVCFRCMVFLAGLVVGRSTPRSLVTGNGAACGIIAGFVAALLIPTKLMFIGFTRPFAFIVELFVIAEERNGVLAFLDLLTADNAPNAELYQSLLAALVRGLLLYVLPEALLFGLIGAAGGLVRQHIRSIRRPV